VSTGAIERRLIAIVAADIAGFSRLMGADEAGTWDRLRAHRAAVDPIVTDHGGRIVKATGDGVLLEFPSVVAAVECAVAIQRTMVERNADVPEEYRMLFRIGVNMGDVMVDGNDIMGDGVNVAARLEALAEPGGILISEDAWRQVIGKVSVTFDDIGEQRLKNIERPIRAYRLRAAQPQIARREVSVPRLSIIVLPFLNLGGSEEYFVDGITETLTTDLSRLPGALVIARNTAFTYKGKSVDVKQVGRELGVRYAVEGSVQHAGNRCASTFR
jgi:class 3 adenylate cyclase